MIKCLFVLFLAATFAQFMYAQTADDLATKYKKLETYEVRPGILMTARFGTDGKVCQMVLQKDRYPSENRVDLRYHPPHELGTELVDELAPVAERGAAIRGGLPGTVSGNVLQTKLNYENVSIEEIGGFSNPCIPGTAVIIIRWKNRGCTFPKSTESRNDKAGGSTLPK